MLDLNDDTFIIFAAANYDIKKALGAEEFYEDLKRFQHIRKIFKRYSLSNEINSRLVLNHIIVLFNCFGSKTSNFLFLKLEGYHEYLIPFLLLLNQLSDTVEYDSQKLQTTDIKPDEMIISQLREI